MLFMFFSLFNCKTIHVYCLFVLTSDSFFLAISWKGFEKIFQQMPFLKSTKCLRVMKPSLKSTKCLRVINKLVVTK